MWEDDAYDNGYYERPDPRDYADEDERDYYERPDRYDEDYPIDGVGFADPGGRSALRAATRDNPRDEPCPTCGQANRLTRLDVARRYQCDSCADQAERGF